MEKIKILSIIGLVFVTFISDAQENRYIKKDAYEGVIFTKYCWATSERAKYPYFPTDGEIATMEKKITDSISDLLSTFQKQQKFTGRCDIVKDLQRFKRQYYGYWNKGDKVIQVFFYKYVPENWKEVMYPNEKGGWCNEFSLEYSIKSGKLYNFFTDLSSE